MLSPTHVHITVHRATNLKTVGKAGTNDAYAVVQLGTETHRSSVKERSKDPVWNEEYILPVPSDVRNSDVIKVSVHHRSLLGLDEQLGRTEIPLYKIHLHRRARVRRYALYNIFPSRGSLSKSSQSTNHRTVHSPPTDTPTRPRSWGVDSLESPDDMERRGQSPSSTEGEAAAGEGDSNQRGEIELIIAFIVQSDTGESHRQPAILAEQEAELKAARRKSMPSSVLVTKTEEHSGRSNSVGAASKKRRSLMSLLDVPQAFNALRRSRQSTDDPGHIRSVSVGTKNKKQEQNNDSPGTSSRITAIFRAAPVKHASDSNLALYEKRYILQTQQTESEEIDNKDTGQVQQMRKQTEKSKGDINKTEDANKKDVDLDDDETVFSSDSEVHAADDPERPKTFATAENLARINRYQPTTEEIGLFAGYYREDLISTVIRQHARLTLAEAYIGDLEHYVNSLVLRVMDEKPRLLQNPYLRPHSEPTTTPNSRNYIPRFSRKTTRPKLPHS